MSHNFRSGTADRFSARAAFTLLEMLIVIALVALLSGAAIYNLTRANDNARIDLARAAVDGAYRSALGAFQVHMGRFPTTAEGLRALMVAPENGAPHWRGPYLDERRLPLDPWNHEYRYELPGMKNPGRYDLYSLGPDGVAGTADDIGNW